MAFINALRTQIVSTAQAGGSLYKCIVTRSLNTELTTALRPFYFAVHPDLFGQHPMQRKTNEESLKLLSAHLEMLYEGRFQHANEAKELQFYVRDTTSETRNSFKLIQIRMDKQALDPKAFIEDLLKTCNLPTDYIKNIKSASRRGFSAEVQAAYAAGFKPSQDYKYGSEFHQFDMNFQQAKADRKVTLDNWMEENAAKAQARSKEMTDLKAEVEKLQKELVKKLGLRDARYDCGWNIEHYRGCLKSLERLAMMHGAKLDPLRDRIVVFAPFTGISLEGHVMLFTGDVLNNWIDFIKNIPQHDVYLKMVPLYEMTLSQVLLGIQIGRRKFMPKQQAKEYAGHLMKVTTALNDYLSLQKYPKSWPPSLAEYKIVVESEAGPLMVSPTGQFIAPATCPGWILVDFITAHLDLAKERMAKYTQEKQIERKLTQQCIKYLQLHGLTKDDSVTPDKMIIALTQLLKAEPKSFANINLHVTNYYSVLTDGIVCVPWDFMSRQ